MKDLLRMLQSAKGKDDLMQKVSEAFPTGTTDRVNNSTGEISGTHIDAKTLKPTNYPALNDDNYKDYKDDANWAVARHVNDTNRKLLDAAITSVPHDKFEESLKYATGVDPSTIPLKITPLQGRYGETFHQESPMKSYSGVSLDDKNELQDATLAHELKHVHDSEVPHVQIPTFYKKRDDQAFAEQNTDNIDDTLKNWQNNDFGKLSDAYSGNHFSHDSDAETAAKIANYNRLQNYMKQGK